MQYLVEPMQLSGSVCKSGGCGALTECQCYNGTNTCGCDSVDVDVCGLVDLCGCKGGREGCCGLGGRTPENRSLPSVI